MYRFECSAVQWSAHTISSGVQYRYRITDLIGNVGFGEATIVHLVIFEANRCSNPRDVRLLPTIAGALAGR
jgi:hypothetical protein